MKKGFLMLMVLQLLVVSSRAQETHTFSNADGKTLVDRITKYDSMEHVVLLENAGKVPLDTFSENDQAYILQWNQVEGFKSTMRFKMDIKKDTWARMKNEQTITPYIMDAIQIPGKKTPNHHVIMVDDFEEYNAVYLEAEGYSLTLRNQNVFPLENLTVESKVFYEQENYVMADSLFNSDEKEYFDTVVTNKVRFLSESIPIIIPREEVVMNSECAITVDQQVERNALVSTTEGDDGSDAEEADTTVEGFGEWDDHGRRRKGKVTGVWFHIGMKDTNGEMVWRDITSPSSLSDKMTWDSPQAVEE